MVIISLLRKKEREKIGTFFKKKKIYLVWWLRIIGLLRLKNENFYGVLEGYLSRGNLFFIKKLCFCKATYMIVLFFRSDKIKRRITQISE